MAAETIVLPDGRALGTVAWGPRDGTPVLYFHGAAGSPMDRDATAALLGEWGVRWIVVQRPGFGASCRAPGRTLDDWARDVEWLADAHGLEDLRIVGVSAGAPYALAAAARLSERVRAVAAVAAVCPQSLSGALTRRPVRGVAAALGVRRVLDDVVPLLSAWPFALADVRADVHVWHGARDRVVPVASAVRLAGELPRARLTVCAGEGHFFFRRRVGEVLGGLVGAERPPSLMVCA